MAELDDDNWRRLSTAAQKWYNAADEASEKGEAFPDFAPAVEAEEVDEEVDEVADDEAEDDAAVAAAEGVQEDAASAKSKKEVKMVRKTKSKSANSNSNKKDGHAEKPTRAVKKAVPKRRAATRGGEYEGSPSLIQRALIKNPQITKAEMMEILEKKGSTASAVTVSSHLSINKSMLRKLKEAGHLKGLSI